MSREILDGVVGKSNLNAYQFPLRRKDMPEFIFVARRTE